VLDRLVVLADLAIRRPVEFRAVPVVRVCQRRSVQKLGTAQRSAERQSSSRGEARVVGYAQSALNSSWEKNGSCGSNVSIWTNHLSASRLVSMNSSPSEKVLHVHRGQGERVLAR